jgi:hypothetical protein
MPLRGREAAKIGIGVTVLVAGAAAPLLAAGDEPERRAAAAATPALRLLDSSPVRFAGRGFAPGERVRVRASAAGSSRTRRVSAGARGRFRVTFRHLSHDRCSGLLIARAIGSEGRRASYKRPQPQCPPPLEPAPPRPPDEGAPSGSGDDGQTDRCSEANPGADRQCPPVLRPPPA